MNNAVNRAKQLQKSINMLLHDSELYRIMAKSAPGEQSQAILEDFSTDCRRSADEFMNIYRTITGYRFEPRPLPVKETGSYRSVMKMRIPAELRASRRFREEYLSAGDNFRLKRAYFNAYHEAIERAVGMTEMLLQPT